MKLIWFRFKGRNSLGLTLFITIMLIFIFGSGNSANADSLDKPCTKIGTTIVFKEFDYLCAKKQNKLTWKLVGPHVAKPQIFQMDESSKGLDFLRNQAIGDLIWSDEFTGIARTQPNADFWSPLMGNYSNPSIVMRSGDLVTSDGSPKGLLKIKTQKINDPSLYNGICSNNKFCQFKSGAISTRNKLVFKYGYLEARMKMPIGSGNWSALWMLRDGNYDKQNPTPGEIDITEVYGNKPYTSWSTLHFKAANTEDITSLGSAMKLDSSLSNDFHTYAIAWLPDSITFLLDGKTLITFKAEQISTWPFNNFFYLIVNGGVGPQPNSIYGGLWDGWQESILSVDWIRFWKINGYGEIGKKTIPIMTVDQMLQMLK